MGKSMFGSFKNETAVEGINNFRGGDYLVLLGEGQFNSPKVNDSEYTYYKFFGTIILTLEDLGDSQGPGDEISHAIFKRKNTSFFEREMKQLVMGCKNLDKAAANALTEDQIWDFLVEKQFQKGRVLEVKARIVPARAKKGATEDEETEEKAKPTKTKHQDGFLNVYYQRALMQDEVMALIKAASEKQRKRALKVLKELAPQGIRQPKVAS